jgi:hypothetical protein
VRKALAEDLKKTLGGVAPKDYKYWDVVSSSALVRGRSFGFVSGMFEAELEYYEVLAMKDERMCPICGEMNGRVFSVVAAQALVVDVLRISDSIQFKAELPWQTKPATGVSNKTLMNHERGKGYPAVPRAMPLHAYRGGWARFLVSESLSFIAAVLAGRFSWVSLFTVRPLLPLARFPGSYLPSGCHGSFAAFLT